MKTLYRLLRDPSTAALIIALSGCATVPTLGKAPVVRPVSELAATRSLPSNAGQWPTDKWWLAYNDATLNGLIEEAIAGSPDLTIALARFRAANALARHDPRQRLPEVVRPPTAPER